MLMPSFRRLPSPQPPRALLDRYQESLSKRPAVQACLLCWRRFYRGRLRLPYRPASDRDGAPSVARAGCHAGYRYSLPYPSASCATSELEIFPPRLGRALPEARDYYGVANRLPNMPRRCFASPSTGKMSHLRPAGRMLARSDGQPFTRL